MANSGAKYASVNLNKSYGGRQQQYPSHYQHYSAGGGGSYAAAGAGRGRVGAGGMVVLSRNRGVAPKVAPKLSVPPPLNLPSLRKEHEKFDMSGSSGGLGAGSGGGGGARPSSSGVGWTKPIVPAAVLPEKSEGVRVDAHVEGVDGVTRVSGSYMPPSARSAGAGVAGSSSGSRDFASSVGKSMVLRGEDFPSLQDARPTSSGTSQKHKDGLNQKQRQVVGEEMSQDKKDNFHLGPTIDARPLVQPLGNNSGNGSADNDGEGRGVGKRADHTQKQKDYFPDPLPLVRLNPRSDWADDERDTGLGFLERGRDTGYAKSESYWDRDFDLPRASVLPHKTPQMQHDRRGLRDNEAGKNYSSEVSKIDPYSSDTRAPSREGGDVSRWRSLPVSRDGITQQDGGSDRVSSGSRMATHSNIVKDNKYIPPTGDNGRDGNNTYYWDSTYGKRDLGYVGRQQQWNNYSDSYNNRGTDRNFRDRHVSEQSNRYMGDNFQNNAFSRPSAASSGKVLPVADPILTMGRDKRYSKGDKPFAEDPFSRDMDSAGFDEGDLFSGGLVGVIKRKKDAAKPTDFHDPVRESFEAELERVQKMQELERQKIIEEQERALEYARREEEERQRRIREEEDRQRKLEEEAREAAWRAEQEQLEAVRKAEELKIAREEEKRRLNLEEERRRQAAKQKLLELEAKMAKRQTPVTKDEDPVSNAVVDEKLEATMKEKEISRNLELDAWEDRERMVEKVSTSTSFNTFAPSRPVEMGLRPYPPREGSSLFVDSGKAINSWRRDVLDNGVNNFPSSPLNHEIGHYSPRRDALGGGRAVPRKDFHAGPPNMPSRPYSKEGVRDLYLDEFGYQKDHRWNIPGDGDSHGKFREMDSEFPDGAADRYGDYAWSQEHSRVSARSPYPERMYPNPESNELYSYGKSRYSVRQPRVLPPPLASAQRTNARGFTEHSGASSFLHNEPHYMHTVRSESPGHAAYYGGNKGGMEPSGVIPQQQETTTIENQNFNATPRCDSPSSLSVSSPPTSPPHLSHDEFDESGESRMTSAVEDGKRSLLTGSELNENSGKGMLSADSVSAVEDEEWMLENDDTLQLQEEYDEDEEGFREDDEVREVDDNNLQLNLKLGLELEDRDTSDTMDNVVLGFDEGVEVVIPSDDSDKLEGSLGVPDGSVSAVKEKGEVGVLANEQSFLPANDSAQTTADSTSGKVTGTKSLPQGSIRQPVMAPFCSTTSDLPVGTDSSGHSCLPSTVSSLGDITSSAGVISLPSLSSAGGLGDTPVQLQFGLFSGPSLIPSPVHAIQIGSIQMPLHIHPPIGPSLTHVRASQSPMFQFGQLHYTSPISQGILPMVPQSTSYVKPNTQGQNTGGPVTQPTQDTSAHNVINAASLEINKQPKLGSATLKQSNGNLPAVLHSASDADSRGYSSVDPSRSSGLSGAPDKTIEQQSELPSSSERSSDQLRHVQPTARSVGEEKNFNKHRGAGTLPGGRGGRFTYSVKTSNTRSYSQSHDMPADFNGYHRRPRRTVQRTEFRVRENNDGRQGPSFGSSNNAGFDENSIYLGKSMGGFTRRGSKRGTFSNRTNKQRTESDPTSSGSIVYQEVNHGDKATKDSSVKSRTATHHGETSLRRNVSEEDVDAPLQSGIVRIFKQSGIEAPSDDDDFIEVRSKRQMLNDRREQREKEIKAKSSTIKAPRKQRFTRQNGAASRSYNKVAAPSHVEKSDNSTVIPALIRNEVSTGFPGVAPQPQAPIGTLVPGSEAQPIKPPQVALSAVSSGAADSGPTFEIRNKVKENAQSSSTTWSAPCVNQQVMSLTQTQFDEAMKPAQSDSHPSSHSGTVSDPIMTTSSMLAKDKSFSSGSSPINSLLAGEKIQFGAVTSPTVLPPSTRAITHGIGAPGSNRSDMLMARNFNVAENDGSLFFGKEKHPNDSCVPLQDGEAEAEAAASAVAVAAISSDEMVVSGLGSANIPETKSFGGADLDGITAGVVGDQQLASQPQGEESLSVSLPADLSVETTPMSFWPPLPSPQSSSSQMLSHFPGGPPSHYPFYEMNPMLGGPIYTFSSHEESSVAQAQPQKSTPSTSGPLGNWHQPHSGVESYYGPPAGFPGPFVSPPGGIPGVQAPPHMVVYNHFAPVGQYGQVGLSFMGTTYIPSGKQADWKHTPISSALHIGDGDLSSISMGGVQRSTPNMPSSIQHLAPGSPLLPMGSPLPMFDVSPFQTGPDMSIQARWAHIPAPHIHSVPTSHPLHPQVEGALASQVNQGHSHDQPLPVNRFPEPRVPTSSENGTSFTSTGATSSAPFPGELSDSLRSANTSSGQSIVAQSSSGSSGVESGKSSVPENGLNNDGKNHKAGASSLKGQFTQKNVGPGHQGGSGGYNYPRGGGNMNRSNAGNEWSHRRTGFHGRSQSGGADKGFPGSKMKQIYVAKQTTKASSTE